MPLAVLHGLILQKTMTIELLDMDVPYEVQTDVNDDGVDFVRIMTPNAPEEYTICLTEVELDELTLVLQFMKKVLKSNKK